MVDSASPGVRVKIAVVLCGAVVGTALLSLAQWFRPDLEAWLREDPRARIPIVVFAVTILMLPLLVFAGYLWRRAGRMRHARVLRALATMLALAALMLIALFWRIAATIQARV